MRFSSRLIRYLTILWVGYGLVIGLASSLRAGEPPVTPFLRIETGMHTAVIGRIGVDAANRYLVTASEDKTLRVWELATGKLLSTLRVPIGMGNEGMLFAVAISPDGTTVAAAGWTGRDWDGEDSIYFSIGQAVVSPTASMVYQLLSFT